MAAELACGFLALMAASIANLPSIKVNPQRKETPSISPMAAQSCSSPVAMASLGSIGCRSMEENRLQ